MSTLHDFSATAITGEDASLAAYDGKVVLVVNTASKCGFTPQYEGLEALYERYADQGFAILGFPCDQFAHQEPGDEAEIADFCSLTYGVTFPMFAKVEVNGDGAAPLYQFLRAAQPNPDGTTDVTWNFTKFLVAKDGRVLRRFEPKQTPAEIEAVLPSLLRAAP